MHYWITWLYIPLSKRNSPTGSDLNQSADSNPHKHTHKHTEIDKPIKMFDSFRVSRNLSLVHSPFHGSGWDGLLPHHLLLRNSFSGFILFKWLSRNVNFITKATKEIPSKSWHKIRQKKRAENHIERSKVTVSTDHKIFASMITARLTALFVP